MINDDLDEEEVSWYSTRMVSWYDGLRTRMNGICVDCHATPSLITPPLRVYPSLPPTNYLINYSSIDYV